MFCVREDICKKYPGKWSPYLAEGTSRLGMPSPDLLKWLEHDGLELNDVAVEMDVEVWSFRKLAEEFGVSGVD
eukprot:3966120-Prorocentrum_lima.AAC.1